ncbi:uncharacterized protein LOC114527856 isoform X2 [Dendronephthya gigantea]|uniref:uncharacterized protein LOC114527856 isoform X2 n=1 Tax=Dendronephthya gigantea TaxID=151771 RepID=UPI00106B850E|nr:uncharacterized protein LOC114527856 isoform X2 [Dendronephthya gigantea]
MMISDNGIEDNEDHGDDVRVALPTNKYAVQRWIENFLGFLVCLHSDYLAAPETSQCREKCKELKSFTMKTKEKIFPTNPKSTELHDTEDDTKMLEEFIAFVTSRCQEELDAAEKTVGKKDLDDDTGDTFYQKLFYLVNGVHEGCSTPRNEEAKSNRNPSSKLNSLGQTACSLEQRVSELEAMLEQQETTYQEKVSKYESDIAEHLARIGSLEESLRKTEEALNEIATEYYGVKAENEKKKKDAKFRKLLKLNPGPSTSEDSQPSGSEESNIHVTIPNPERQIIMEESCAMAEQTLTNVPTNSVELHMYNTYKLLLLRISDMLLQHDKEMLQDWATSNYSVQESENAFQILVHLDEKKIISSSNLHVLRDFFGTITRYDLVHIIENFIAGDFSLLRKTQSTISVRNRSIRGNGNLRLQASGSVPLQQRTTSKSPKISVEEIRTGMKVAKVPEDRSVQTTIGGGTRRPVVADSAYNSADSRDTGSNSKKFSKPKRAPDPEQHRLENHHSIDDAGPWLCDHYKRRCYVKFECCETFWPCHRCHNNRSECGRKKLKSRDITLIKCMLCQKEQPFNENSQFCNGCGVKFAEYFCGRCKHLTGTDDNPYHCEKCGICRIHGDRSFHCDVCGVCLDVQLKNNHKCRAGSAHDECCICLELGCQVGMLVLIHTFHEANTGICRLS